MAKTFWKKIDDIFPLVADLPTGERELRLRELCAGDEDLRREISSMLAADEKAEKFIEVPAILPDSLSYAFAATGAGKSSTREFTGRQIGAYRIERKIGSGGMGAVYLAERADGEFRKKVAIKLVKNGADTSFNLRRFRHERQILADLEHPFIARLLDGGTTADGTPYLVMEYVEGLPLFNYCQSWNLDVPARLALFRQICQAVSYAHEKGIVHRDIKPGNILVAADGTPKLLDFGIAKILDSNSLHDSSAQTETLFRQMTPEYASPEQINGERVTPASDVYSLGVVLYELVAGERPYKFNSRAPHEIARIICEQEVPAPKINLKTHLSDDLKFIVLKSLRKKPLARYSSVAELDQDIARFLAKQPILSENMRLAFFGKPTDNTDDDTVSLAIAPFKILPGENGDKFSAENDFLSIGLADALTTRLSGVHRIAVRPTTSVLRLATEDISTREFGERLEVDFILTGHILRSADQIRISVQLLKIDDDHVVWAGNFDESDLDIFRLQDSISERVAAALVPQLTAEEQKLLHQQETINASAFESYLRGRISYCTYTFEGITASEKYFKEAIGHDPEFALAHSGLADFYNWQTVAGFVSNEEGFARAKASARKAIELDPHLAEAYTSLAFATWAYDWDFAEAERLFQKSIRLNPNYMKAHEWYALLLSISGKCDESIEEMRRAERLDPDSPAVAAMFALIFYNARRYRESLEKTRRALDLDPNYYLALQSLGWICPPLGKFDEAIAGARRAVEVSGEMTLNKLSLALALADAGQIDEARSLAAEIQERKQTTEVPAYFLALVYNALRDEEKAFYWFDQAIRERGYWTLRMLTEPRLDSLRTDPRFIKRLELIEPLDGAAQTTAAIASPATGKIYNRGRAKTRAAIVAAFICLIFAGAYVAVNFKIIVKKFPDKNQPPIAASGNKRNEKPLTNDTVACELYLAGKEQMSNRTRDGVNKALEFFAAAAERDPRFALAFSGLADAHILRAEQIRDKNDYRKAEDYAVKALALEPDLPEARISLGMAKFRNTNDFDTAEKHFLRAIEIDPSLATARHWYGIILYEVGKHAEALREVEIAANLDPKSAVIQHTLAEYYMKAGNYDQAILYFDKAIAIDNSFVAAYFWKSLAQQFLGQYDAALETHRKGRIYSGDDENEPFWLLMQAQTHAFHSRREEAQAFLNRYFQTPHFEKHSLNYACEIAIVYNLLGDRETAFDWLGKLKISEAEQMKAIMKDPRLANLQDDKRFAALVKKWQNKT